MKVIHPEDFTDRGWKEDFAYPPGFFYPAGASVPHLHLTSVFEDGDKKKPIMAYLGYKNEQGTQVIFKDKNWHEKVVDSIPNQVIKDEANFAHQYSKSVVGFM